MLKNVIDQAPVLTEAMLRRLDRPGPRYTSYPTADRFTEAFGPDAYAQALADRASGAVVGGKRPLSVYVHLPFCESVCYYCACNKVITKHHERSAEYLEVLAQELALNVSVLGSGQAVSQLHLGGGTPTFLTDSELSNLMVMLAHAFRWTPGAEELHADDIEQVLAFFAVQQSRIGEQGSSLALDPLQCLPEGREQHKPITAHALIPSRRMAWRRAGFIRSRSRTRSTGRCSSSSSSCLRWTVA